MPMLKSMPKSKPHPDESGIQFPSPQASGSNTHLRDTLVELTRKQHRIDGRLAAVEAHPALQKQAALSAVGSPGAGTPTGALGTSLGPSQAPAKATAPGVPGQSTWDSAGYHYLCIGPNKWVRSAAPYTTF